MTSASYQVIIGDRSVRIQVRRESERVFVRVDDGDEQPASLSHVRGPMYALTLGEQRGELLATSVDEGVWLVLDGLDYRAEVVDEAHARLASVAGGRSAGHARRELKAPMPGLVVKVIPRPGDTIEPGQPLAVLQAMKMENELSLPRGGTVTAVYVRAGQAVEQGQVLLVVE
jgi:acetyl/propionyl-CoA carboxylase alpha subunit